MICFYEKVVSISWKIISFFCQKAHRGCQWIGKHIIVVYSDLTPLEQICPLEKFWSGSSDPTITSDPLYSLWKRQKLKIWILFLQWSKCIPINLKGTLETFDEKFEGFYVPHRSQMWRNKHFWPKTAIWDLKRDHGVCRSSPIFV